MPLLHARLRSSLVPLCLLLALSPAAGMLASAPAAAQAIALTVNDDPITSYDIEQRMKLQRILKRPATRDAAIEALTADKLRLREIKKVGINPGNAEMGTAIARIAGEMKTTPQALAQAVQSSGIPESHWTEFFRAEAGWGIYVRAMNKTLEVSEQDVRAELKKKGGKTAAPNEFQLRQIVFVVPTGSGPDKFQARAREAEQLRLRFTSCAAGLPLARGLPDVAVKEEFSRNGNTLGEQMRDLLEKTPVGHLTPPQRGPSGIELVAVCNKRDLRDDVAVGEDIRQEMLNKRLDGAGAKLYADLRKRAVVVKR